MTAYLLQLSKSLVKNVISFGVGSVLFSFQEYGGLIKPIVGLKSLKTASVL
jgi:hypothetical protein